MTKTATTTEVTMTQPKMTQAERRMVLAAHAAYASDRRGSALSSKRTHFKTINGAQDKGFVGYAFAITPAGLRAAGVDLDAIHAEALAEDERYVPPALSLREYHERIVAETNAATAPAPAVVDSSAELYPIGARVAGEVRGQSFTGTVSTTFRRGAHGETVETVIVCTDAPLTMPSGRKVNKAQIDNPTPATLRRLDEQLDPTCPTCGGVLDTGTADAYTCTECGDEWEPETLAAVESLTPTLDERAAFIASIRIGSRVVVRHAGREIAGQVTSTAAQGTTLLSIGFYARELGPNRIDNAIGVEPVDILRPAPPRA